MTALPPGFSMYQLGDGWAALRDDLAEALLGAGAGRPDELPCEQAVMGRVPHPVVDLGEGRGRVVVRKCWHGGAFGRVMGRAFVGASRALKELAVAAAARENGAPVPEVVGVVAEPWKWGLKHLFVLSKVIPNAVDLRGWLESDSRPSPSQRQAVSRAVAKAVAVCHQAGLYHADLHVRNVLIEAPDGPEPQAYLIDLDKASAHKRLAPLQRLLNLARLNRSIEKWADTRRLVSRRDKLRFLRAYQRHCGGLGPGAQYACGRVPLKHQLAWLGIRLAEMIQRS